MNLLRATSILRKIPAFLAAAAIASLLLAVPQARASGINQMLAFRGTLKYASGSVVSDGTYAMAILIYDDPTAGTCLYSMVGTCGSPTTKSVSVTNGSFQTLIGDTGDNTLSLTFNTNLFYLELRVAGETMSPRLRIASAAQSFNTLYLGGLAASSVVQSDADDFVSGQLTFSLPPSGTGIGSGTAWINPGSTSSNRTIFGISAATSTNLLSLDSEGDLRILGNFTPYNNTWTALGAFGSAFNGVYASGTAYLGTVSSTLITPWSHNDGSLGVFGNAFQNLYVSSTAFFGPVSSTLITPWSNNASDIGAFGNAWRDIYASGSGIFGSLRAASSSPNYTDAEGLTARAGVRQEWGPLNSNGVTVDAGGYFYTSTSVSQALLTIGLRAIADSASTLSVSNNQVIGLEAIARTNPGMGGSTSLGNLTGAIINGTLAASSTVTRLEGVRASIAPASGAAGSYVSTGTAVMGRLANAQNVTFRNVAGVLGEISGSAGQIANSFGVFGRAIYGSNTFGGYFSASPLWVDADDIPDSSDHGASNTPGAAFVGNILEVNGNAFFDGRLQASSTALLSLGATSSHIYPWTNNAHDIGTFGNAWQNLYVSSTVFGGTVSSTLITGYSNNAGNLGIFGNAFQNLYVSSTSFLGQVSSTGITPWSNNTTDLGGFGLAWRSIYVSNSIFIGTDTASSTLIGGNLLFSGSLVPSGNNVSDIGAFGNALRFVYVSDSVRIGSGAASTTISASGNITLTGSLVSAAANTSDVGAVTNGFRSLFASTSVHVSSGAASTTLGSGNLSLSGSVFSSSNNTSDVGAFGAAFRNIYASGTLFAGSISSTMITGWVNNATNLGIFGNAFQYLVVSSTAYLGPVSSTLITPWSNNASDIGVFGNAWRNIYVSSTSFLGPVSTTLITPWANNTYDLGAFGNAWSNIISSGTAYLAAINLIGGPAVFAPGSLITANGGVSSTMITPIANDVYDLGAFGAAFRNLYVSSTVFGGTVSSTLITPWSNNASDIGVFGNAWRNIYTSGSLRVGTGAASGTWSSAGMLSLSQAADLDGALLYFTATGTHKATPTNAAGNAAFVFDTTNDLTASGPTSTALFLLRENGSDRFAIVATSSDELHFRSYAVSSTANKTAAFVLETVNYIGSSTFGIASDNVLLSLRNQPAPGDSSPIDPEFAVYAGGNVVADGTFTSNGNPGDVAEYVEIVGDPGEPGDVLVVSNAADGTYQKSDSAYAGDAAGVVATTPKFIIGAPNGSNAPLVLAGLARVKVTDESGPIARGDLLVTASEPGHAMRFDPEADTGRRMVAVLGIALSPLASDSGVVDMLVRPAWVSNRSATIAKVARELMKVADATGVRIESLEADRTMTVVTSSGGNMIESNRYASDSGVLTGVAGIQGLDGLWEIDGSGNFKTAGTLETFIQTSRGRTSFYAVTSPKVELTLSGSSRMDNGLATIEFSDDFRESIDPDTAIRVLITPTSPAAIYVAEKNPYGFTVRTLGAGSMDAEFDWLVIARRKGYGEPVEAVVSSDEEQAVALPAPAEAPVVSHDEQVDTLASPVPAAEPEPVSDTAASSTAPVEDAATVVEDVPAP